MDWGSTPDPFDSALTSRGGSMTELVHFTCPSCHARLKAKSRASGRIIDCPKCRNRLLVPDQDELDQKAPPVHPPVERQGEPEQHRFRKLIIVGTVAAAIFVAVGLGGYYLLRQTKAPTDREQPEVLASLISLKDGEPLLAQKGKPVFPAGTKIKDTPDGMFLI